MRPLIGILLLIGSCIVSVTAGYPKPDVPDSVWCSAFKQDNHREKTEAAYAAVAARSSVRGISDTLLFCCFQDAKIRTSGRFFSLIKQGWRRSHPSVSAAFARYHMRGAPEQANMLGAIFDEEHLLSFYDLLRWVEIKQVLGLYAEIPELYCRVLYGEPRIKTIVLSQFATLLREVPQSVVDTLLQHFLVCSSEGQLPAGPRTEWVIAQYGRLKLFDRQIELFLATEKQREQQAIGLIAIGEERYRQQSFVAAAKTAELAYRRATGKDLKERAATLVYHALRELGSRDSAQMWFKRAHIVSDRGRAQGAELFLSSGNPTEASRLIAQLSHSVLRDTLHLHQLLATDSLSSAVALLAKGGDFTGSAATAYIWRVRTLLFGGRAEACLALLDSIPAPLPAVQTRELLGYRYWLLRLAYNEEALAIFAQIEYTLYKEKPGLAADLLCSVQADTAYSWRLAVRVAQAALKNGNDPAGALRILGCAPADSEPEYLYCKADAFYRLRKLDAAEQLLKRLVLEYPDDVHTVKARLLLAKVLH